MKRSVFVLVLAVVVVAVALAGCLEDEKEKYAGSFEDEVGNVVSIPEPPQRIISLAPSLTEILVELDLHSRLVGCDEASNEIGDVGDLPQVSTWQGLDLEKAVSLLPDIVLMDKTLDMSGDIYSALTEAEIPVFVFFPKSMEDMMDQVTTIGEICDRVDKAGELRSELEERIEAVSSVSGGFTQGQRPKVLYVTYYDGSDNPWVGTDSTMSADLIEMAGGENIVDDNTGFCIQVSLEIIVAEDPDIILVSQSATWPTPTKDAILEDDTLGDVSAVKDGWVYEIDGDLVDRPGPRMVDGLEEIHGHVSEYVAA